MCAKTCIFDYCKYEFKVLRKCLELIDDSRNAVFIIIDKKAMLSDNQISPHIWRSEEFECIINQLKEMCFARKFDEKVDYQIVE